MTTGSRVRVYIATSLDGFIAGPGDDLSWLPTETTPNVATDAALDALEPPPVSFEGFMSEVGAMIMGRRTYDVVCTMGVWPYGETPVFVPTHRSLDALHPSARAASGTIEELVALAREAADGKDVYLDGGNVIRQALDAGLIDEIIVTVVPTILGEGISLFAGTKQRHSFTVTSVRRFTREMVQLRFTRASK